MRLKIVTYINQFMLCLMVSVHVSQAQVDTGVVVKKEIDNNGDTLYSNMLDEFMLKSMDTEEARKKYLKLIYNTKKVMPYAKLAAFRIQMLEDNLNQINGRKERNKYLKATEKQIKREFLEDLKKLSKSQGKLLLKLIHRETGKTTFSILKGYRGGATTIFWSAMAKFYDASLKVKFDPIEDYQINYIIEKYKLE